MISILAFFTFTLGVHYAKRLAHKEDAKNEISKALIDTVSDQLPRNQDMNDLPKSAEIERDDAISQELHHEVTRAGLHLDAPKATVLPADTKSKKSSYFLQLGSYQSQQEAENAEKKLLEQKKTLIENAFAIEKVTITDKGIWYRLYYTGLESKEAAEKMRDIIQKNALIMKNSK